MKQQQDSGRQSSQPDPQEPKEPKRQDEGRESRQSPGGQGGQRETDGAGPNESAPQEQDDFGGIGKQDQGGQEQRPQDPSRQR